ncbi:MAG: hypothetical protein ACTINL_03735 [Serratia proteamaculans]
MGGQAVDLFTGKERPVADDDLLGNNHGGNGGGSNMNERVVRLEVIAENTSKVLSEIKSEIKENSRSINQLEKRTIDKIDENQKWLVALLVSSILMPLFIALVVK